MRVNPSSLWHSVLLAMLAILVAADPASAHALGAECKLRGNRIEVEAYYDDDTPARNARIAVFDEQKNLVVQGRTDAQGKWSFAKPRPGVYQVVVDAGAGHSTSVRMTVTTDKTATEVSAPDVESAEVTISEGPDREEFTRFPWPQLALGLGVIAAAGLAGWFVLHRRRAAAAQNSRPALARPDQAEDREARFVP